MSEPLRLGDTLRRPGVTGLYERFIWAVQSDGLEVRSYHNLPVRIEVIPWRDLPSWTRIKKNPKGRIINLSKEQNASS